MSKVLSKRVITLFFALLFAVSLFAPFIQADPPGASSSSSKVSKSAKKTKLKHKTGTEILSEIMDIISAFGGDAVETAIGEFTANLEQTASLLQSLAKEETVDSVNFLIRNAISSFSEGARNVSSSNGSSETVQASDFGEFLENFKSTLIKRCKGKSNFSAHILPQVELVLPHLLEGLNDMYKNVINTTGFGLTFGMLNQGTSLLMLLERPEYVSKDTFSQFVSFPNEIKHQFETVVEELVSNYVDPTQLDMMLNMAKMYATSFANRRAEHEDL